MAVKNFGRTPDANLKPQGLKLLEYCKAKGYVISEFNIINLEGINTDLATINADRLDEWNDVRVVMNSAGDILMSSLATTEPGKFYTNKPMNANGAARLAFGQYLNCWEFGDHHGQDALTQCGVLTVCRDLNKDGARTGDKVYKGADFGINMHTTSDAPDFVGRWSAGCLVLKFPETHNGVFMPLCRASGLKTFGTILIDGSDFAKFNG